MVAGPRIKLIRNDHLTKNLLVLDGLTGTGKTMMSSILQSFDRVENGRFIYDLEYVSISSYLGAHRSDSAQSLLDLIIDWKLYDNLISREVNFRPTDLSTIFKHPSWFEYIRRLFQDDGASVMERIETINPIMMIITHQLMLAMDPLMQQFRNRIKIVEMVRHPYYLLDHWIASVDLFATTSRDFTVWVDDGKGAPVPWFAQEWRDSYWSLSKFDRAVLSIESLSKHRKKWKSLKIRETTLIIPFEHFVLRTDDYLADLAEWIGTSTTKHTRRICRKQNLPRSNINAGLNKSIYRRYKYNDADKHLSHEKSYMQKKAFAESQQSSISGPVLQRLVNDYEDEFGLWF